MNIHNAHALTLLIIGGRIDKSKPKSRTDEQSRHHRTRRNKPVTQTHETGRIGEGVKALRKGRTGHRVHLAATGFQWQERL